MILITFLSLIMIVASQSPSSDHSLYVRLGSVFESICLSQEKTTGIAALQSAPGKKGPAGAKGEAGTKGSKGDTGEADYDRVEEMVSRKIQEVLDSQARSLSNLSNQLAEANDEIKRLKNETNLIDDRVKNATDYCPIRYKGKCFWVEIASYNHVTYEQARNICFSHGAIPANVYSKEHHYLLMGYLRMLASMDGVMYVWIGMAYNTQTKTAILSDGSTATYVKWYPDYPSTSHCCRMVIVARMDWKDTKQHMHTHRPDDTRRGVICEK